MTVLQKNVTLNLGPPAGITTVPVVKDTDEISVTLTWEPCTEDDVTYIVQEQEKDGEWANAVQVKECQCKVENVSALDIFCN